MAYDKDGNSTLEKEELRVMLADNLSMPKESITQDQVNWHFEQIDDDKDGQITFDEYVNGDIILVLPLLWAESQEKQKGCK